MAAKLSADIAPIVVEGRNCWRIARANRVSVVVDAADYFHYVRELCEEAQNLLLFIGWDFDSRISLEPRRPQQTCEAFELFPSAGASQSAPPDCDPKMRFGALKQFLNPASAWTLARWAATRAIEFKLTARILPDAAITRKLLLSTIASPYVEGSIWHRADGTRLTIWMMIPNACCPMESCMRPGMILRC